MSRWRREKVYEKDRGRGRESGHEITTQVEDLFHSLLWFLFSCPPYKSRSIPPLHSSSISCSLFPLNERRERREREWKWPTRSGRSHFEAEQGRLLLRLNLSWALSQEVVLSCILLLFFASVDTMDIGFETGLHVYWHISISSHSPNHHQQQRVLIIYRLTDDKYMTVLDIIIIISWTRNRLIDCHDNNNKKNVLTLKLLQHQPSDRETNWEHCCSNSLIDIVILLWLAIECLFEEWIQEKEINSLVVLIAIKC